MTRGTGMSRSCTDAAGRTAVGIYAHVPFCERRCDYCDFYVEVDRTGEERFFACLRDDLRLAAGRFSPTRALVDSLYFGGGTPSLVRASQIRRTVACVEELFDTAAAIEISLEANPETVAPEKSASWRSAGVNRLSLGVQSFNDAVLRPRGRCYTSAEAVAAFGAAREAGFRSVGIDLIAGLPGESARSFLDGILRTVALGPDHVSIYLLEGAESLKRTPLARAVEAGRVTLPSEEMVITMYTSAREELTRAGYAQYEISNFARPGFESRHNLKYWNSEPYIGIGPSAHSHRDGRRTCWPADLRAWEAAVVSGARRMDRSLTGTRARAREALVLALRLTRGVELAAFGERWNLDAGDLVEKVLKDPDCDGLVRLEAGRLSLTHRGVLLSNEVFARLV
ncbi:MAG: radical SAM family heme chaperone HemW [Acidobacteriota bacterium]